MAKLHCVLAVSAAVPADVRTLPEGIFRGDYHAHPYPAGPGIRRKGSQIQIEAPGHIFPRISAC